MPAALEPALPCAPRGGAGEGTRRSTFRASGGTGHLLNASLQRARTNGLLTERRRCSLTRRSERQAELEICGPPLKSARGERCTLGGPRGRSAGRPGRGAHTPRASRQRSAPPASFSRCRPALRSCETGAPGPAPGPTWGAWGSGRPPHTTAPEGQGWGAEVTLRLKGLVKSSVAASFLMANAQS